MDGRRLDDNAQVMLRFKGSAQGRKMHRVHEEHAGPAKSPPAMKTICAFASTAAAAAWTGGKNVPTSCCGRHATKPRNQATQTIARATSAASSAAARVTHCTGHSTCALSRVESSASNKVPKFDVAVQFPTVVDGVRGAAFIQALIDSSLQRLPRCDQGNVLSARDVHTHCCTRPSGSNWRPCGRDSKWHRFEIAVPAIRT